MYESTLYTLYTSYMFRPRMWPSSWRCITNTDRYIVWPKHVASIWCVYYTFIDLCSFIGFDMYNCQMHGCWSFKMSYILMDGPGSSVGIATHYGLDGPGIKSRWGARLSAPVYTCHRAHPASRTMGTGSSPGVKERPGPDADPSPSSSTAVMEG